MSEKDNRDTSTIDDVIAYIESPEYLRMTARSQGESAGSLLSGSRTQPWGGVSDVPAPESTPRLHFGDEALITRDYPWSAPLHPGDRVTLISEEFETTDEPSIKWFRIRDRSRYEWSVPSNALEPVSTPLADWEMELLDSVRATGPTLPEPESVLDPVTLPVRLRVNGSFQKFREVLEDRVPFSTSGNLRGVLRPEPGEPGELVDDTRILWNADRFMVDYVVYSYNTPIAWHVSGVSYVDEWVFPQNVYSRTTSRHQEKILGALRGLSDQDVRILPRRIDA